MATLTRTPPDWPATFERLGFPAEIEQRDRLFFVRTARGVPPVFRIYGVGLTEPVAWANAWGRCISGGPRRSDDPADYRVFDGCPDCGDPFSPPFVVAADEKVTINCDHRPRQERPKERPTSTLTSDEISRLTIAGGSWPAREVTTAYGARPAGGRFYFGPNTVPYLGTDRDLDCLYGRPWRTDIGRVPEHATVESLFRLDTKDRAEGWQPCQGEVRWFWVTSGQGDRELEACELHAALQRRTDDQHAAYRDQDGIWRLELPAWAIWFACEDIPSAAIARFGRKR